MDIVGYPSVRLRTDALQTIAQTAAMRIFTNPAGAEATAIFSPRIADHVEDLLVRLFRGLDDTVLLRLWNGTLVTFWKVGDAALSEDPQRFTLVCLSPVAVRAMAFGRDPLRLVVATDA